MNEIIFVITISAVWGLFIWYVSRPELEVDKTEHKNKSKKTGFNE